MSDCVSWKYLCTQTNVSCVFISRGGKSWYLHQIFLSCNLLPFDSDNVHVSRGSDHVLCKVLGAWQG